MNQEPIVPMTLEGSCVLHQMVRLRWREWRALTAELRAEIAAELKEWLARRESGAGDWTACYSMLGHKGDLMFLHFRPDFIALLRAQEEMRRLRVSDYFEHTHSYLSVVELGLYESTRKNWEELIDKGLKPGGEGWEEGLAESVARQKKAMASRLHPEVPDAPFVCFYPMDRLRGESKNWYMVPFAERQRMMHEHGLIGRKYGGEVKQIISGSIGFDDWEWGVDLFANDPMVYKKLIYEMRFDEVSAIYALFGSFYLGKKLSPQELALLL
jgi:peroxiredoxin